MNVIDSPSPHFRATRKSPVDTIVVHYISAVNIDKNDPFNLKLNLDLLRKPIEYTASDGQEKSVKVSAHYLVTREGEVHKMVDENHVAWHAGTSALHGREGCNEFSIGIELMGGERWDFTDEQYDALIALIKDIRTRHKVPKENIVGHDAIALPAGRKKDPGKRFDWDRVLKAVG